MPKIRELWDSFCERVEADPKQAEEVFGWLDRFYSEAGRHYHNWNHIEDCLTKLKRIEVSSKTLFVKHYDELEYALWFHDVIYSFGFQNGDEEASSKFACLCAEKLGISGKLDMFIMCSLILVTKDHEPEIRPYIGFKDTQNIMVDIDLSIFSSSEDELRVYDEAIRNEYFWVPDEDFSKGRVNALKQYFYRDSVYFSPAGYSNTIAKANLKKLIEKYES